MADIAKLIYKKNTLYGGWAEASNVKAFPLSWTWSSASVLAEAQAIYDWWLAGKTPVVIYSWCAFVPSNINSLVCSFAGTGRINTTMSGWVATDSEKKISFERSWDTVTEVLYSTANVWMSYLPTSANPWNWYTPQYDGSPATKKYVDDMVWNIETLLSNI